MQQERQGRKWRPGWSFPVWPRHPPPMRYFAPTSHSSHPRPNPSFPHSSPSLCRPPNPKLLGLGSPLHASLRAPGLQRQAACSLSLFRSTAAYLVACGLPRCRENPHMHPHPLNRFMWQVGRAWACLRLPGKPRPCSKPLRTSMAPSAPNLPCPVSAIGTSWPFCPGNSPIKCLLCR
jgi:hypothetical protein